jgi:hypothetical protein
VVVGFATAASFGTACGRRPLAHAPEVASGATIRTLIHTWRSGCCSSTASPRSARRIPVWRKDLYITADAEAFVKWHAGQLAWAEATRDYRIQLHGALWLRTFPTWNGPSMSPKRSGAVADSAEGRYWQLGGRHRVAWKCRSSAGTLTTTQRGKLFAVGQPARSTHMTEAATLIGNPNGPVFRNAGSADPARTLMALAER